jgi:hypothetical protein
MKNWILGFSIAAILITGFLLLEKDNEAAAARMRAAAAERERDDIAAKASQHENRAEKLQTQLDETQDARRVAADSRTLEQQVMRAVSGGAEQRNRMLRDPRMKKAMETEAKHGIEKNVRSLFDAGLAEHLHLDDAGSAALFQLLTQKRALFWDKMLLPMMTGEIADHDMAAAGQAIRSAFDENKTQIRDLLGESGLSTYEWFEKTESARDEYRQLNTRLAKSGQQLTEDQQGQFYSILTDEYANFKMHYDFEDPSQLDLDHWYNNFTDDKLEVCAQDVDALNERMLQRAQAVLTADQLVSFRELLAERALKARFVVMTTSAMLAKQR